MEREQRVLTKDLVRYYDVDERTVKRWVEAGCPHRKAHRRLEFLLSEVIPWRREQDRKELRQSSTPKMDEEQARKMRADADLSELKVLQMRGELIPATRVEQDMERLCAMVRARVLSVRGRWAPKIMRLGAMAEAAAVLDALAADVLDALRAGADDLDEEPEEGVAA